jgi:vacuolar-type H+-ATPase catalytic subunit A/Vma1
MESTTWYPHCKLNSEYPSDYLQDIKPFVDEEWEQEQEIAAQEYNEVLTFEMEIDSRDRLIATSKFTGKRYQVSNWYRRNVISLHFLECLRWDGKRSQWFNHKDFREYLTLVD